MLSFLAGSRVYSQSLPRCLPLHGACLPEGSTAHSPTPCLPLSALPRSFLTICKCLETGKISHIRSQFVMVTPGILGQQVGPAVASCWFHAPGLSACHAAQCGFVLVP